MSFREDCDFSIHKKYWVGMPEFWQKDLEPYQTLRVHFRNKEDRDQFGELVKRQFTDKSRSLWFPKEEIGRYANKRFLSESPINPRYPVYVISKGRWESRLTVKALEKMRVPYFVVVEPQEFDEYAGVMERDKILTLPFSNLGQGSIPARNWVWKHSLKNGDARHWILDDNIKAFYRLYHNLKTPVGCGNIFRAAEDFVDRFENVALAGFDYFMFASRKSLIPPFRANTRIYSCILIRNDLPHRWRGRYNEDTDLSLRVLKDGHCTILFSAFLAEKVQTMTMKGGNTDELYQGDGRLKMAQSLKDQHPDLVTITRKWGRWQHHVNYKVFSRNKLKSKENPEGFPAVNNYGMYLKLDEGAKLLLIGEAPGKKGNPRRPLQGRIGRKLAEVAGVEYERYKESTKRRNVFDEWPGKDGKGDAWNFSLARKRAEEMVPDLAGKRALFVGRRVAAAFGFESLAWMTWTDGPEGSKVAAIPHPSGIVRWWNEESNRKAAGEFLRSALEDVGDR